MKGSQINNILNLGAKHALYRSDGKWYHHLKYFPGVLIDKNGFLFFNNESEYINHPMLKHKQELHIELGIEKINGYIHFSINQINSISELLNK